MPLLTLKRANGLKTIMVKYSANFWSFLTKSTTFFRFLTLKHKKRELNCQKKLVLLLTLKRTNRLKTSYGEIFGKLLVFVDQKYHFLEILDSKAQNMRLKLKKKIVPLLTLKRANGLKMSYDEIFDKLFVFFDRK